jgi:hypothetical protein
VIRAGPPVPITLLNVESYTRRIERKKTPVRPSASLCPERLNQKMLMKHQMIACYGAVNFSAIVAFFILVLRN